jgi:hypothetical protein
MVLEYLLWVGVGLTRAIVQNSYFTSVLENKHKGVTLGHYSKSTLAQERQIQKINTTALLLGITPRVLLLKKGNGGGFRLYLPIVRLGCVDERREERREERKEEKSESEIMKVRS